MRAGRFPAYRGKDCNTVDRGVRPRPPNPRAKVRFGLIGRYGAREALSRTFPLAIVADLNLSVG